MLERSPAPDAPPASDFVLVVDDSRADLQVIEHALKPLGLSVRATTDAYGALSGLYEQEFAVALIDLRMPGLDGFELAAEIRRHPRASGLPIVFVTAAELSAEEIGRAYSLNAVDVVSKPFRPEVLRAKVSVFVELARRRAASELRMELEELVLATAHVAQEPVRMVNQMLRELHGTIVRHADSDVLDLMDSLRGQARRVNRFVKGLLEFGRLRLDPEAMLDLDLAGPVASALEEIGPRLDEVGGRVSIAAVPRVHAHPGQLALLFYELFDNSVRYRGERPVHIRVSGRRVPGEVLVSVEDDGIGIDPENAARVFEPFRPLPDAACLEGSQGAGMGLALARRVVHLGGGRIWCEPGSGDVGTRVSFTLPAARDEALDA